MTRLYIQQCMICGKLVDVKDLDTKARRSSGDPHYHWDQRNIPIPTPFTGDGVDATLQIGDFQLTWENTVCSVHIDGCKGSDDFFRRRMRTEDKYVSVFGTNASSTPDVVGTGHRRNFLELFVLPELTRWKRSPQLKLYYHIWLYGPHNP